MSPFLSYPAGNVQYFEQLDALREAYILAPEVFTEELFNATFSKPTSPDNWLAVVDFLKKTSPRHQNCTFAKSACIHVDLNFDGIQLFKTGVKETIPLLARITAISTDAGKVFLFSKKMPAFMFGVYCGKGKPDTNELMTELVDELQAGHPQMNALLRMPEETFSTISENLQRYFFTMPHGTFEESNAESEPTPNQTDSSGFSSETNLPTASGSTTPMIDSTPTPKPDEKLTSIAVDRFISDALARRDWTGTVAHSAFWALPRCKQRGFKGAKTGMHYEVIDCTSIRRYDEEWEDYLQPEDTETQVIIVMSHVPK